MTTLFESKIVLKDEIEIVLKDLVDKQIIVGYLEQSSSNTVVIFVLKKRKSGCFSRKSFDKTKLNYLFLIGGGQENFEIEEVDSDDDIVLRTH